MIRWWSAVKHPGAAVVSKGEPAKATVGLGRLSGRWEIGEFGPAGLILIDTKHEEAIFGNAGSRR